MEETIQGVSAGPADRVRVAFFMGYVTPYRVTFFQKLAAHPRLDLLVIHGRVTKERGRPGVEDKKGLPFPNVEVSNREWRLGPFALRWQKGALGTVRAVNPEVVVIQGISGTFSNWTAALWARWRGRRVVMWMCGWEAQPRGSLAYRLKRPFLRLFTRLATMMVVYSTKGRDYMRSLGVPAERIVVCFNGIETDEALRQEPEVRAAAVAICDREGVGERLVFLYVGGILAEKGVDLLLRAWAPMDAEGGPLLWIVGDGPDAAQCRALAAELKLRNVKFWGRVIREADHYFAAADWFVLPGVGGLALNQAMLWNVPCICSEADGTEEDLVYDGQTGLRFSTGDAAALTAALRRAAEIGRGPEQERMGRQGRELVTGRSNVNEMIKTFSECFLAGRPPPGG